MKEVLSRQDIEYVDRCIADKECIEELLAVSGRLLVPCVVYKDMVVVELDMPKLMQLCAAVKADRGEA